MVKKEIRANFRNKCLKRDKYKCVMCSFSSDQKSAENDLDVHHCINRKEISNGGYVPENGISLCKSCHLKAEEFHSVGVAATGYSIEDLLKAIGSSEDKARKASELLR